MSLEEFLRPERVDFPDVQASSLAGKEDFREDRVSFPADKKEQDLSRVLGQNPALQEFFNRWSKAVSIKEVLYSPKADFTIQVKTSHSVNRLRE